MKSLDNSQTISFGIFDLTVNSQDRGGTSYQDPNMYSDIHTPLNSFIALEFKPDVYIDVGANYGFTCLITHCHNPNTDIIAVEASPRLIPYLEHNLSQINTQKVKVINAVCTSTSEGATQFSLNPAGSQDNRVKGLETWEKLSVPRISLDSIISSIDYNKTIYLKIDAQGSEENIFKGAQLLIERPGWILKTEFGPYWLRAQESNPVRFLKELTRQFLVFELPKRFTKKWSIPKYKDRIKPKEAIEFVSYLESLVINSRAEKIGWCDLLLLPKGFQL